MLKTWMKPLAVATLLAGIVAVPALADDTPNALNGAKVVAAEDVAKAQAAGAVVVDTRVASEFAEGHIKGAVSVPYRE